MKHLISFNSFLNEELFIDVENQKIPKRVTEKVAPTIYKDDNLTVQVARTLDASKIISDPKWCSTTIGGFYKHNLTANLYRLKFKDGYRLRLTWDYMPWDGSYSGGTHWGCGGQVEDREIWYRHISPRDEQNPFLFDYNKGDERQEMVDRIKTIPKEAIEAIYRYQKQHRLEKNALLSLLYKEVSKIKVIKVSPIESKGSFEIFYEVVISYNSKKYVIHADLEKWKDKYELDFRFFGSSFEKEFKNRYAFMEFKALSKQLETEFIEWLKNNNRQEYQKIQKLLKVDK
jgi:hypothetical protein